jgi:hypothetical protein
MENFAKLLNDLIRINFIGRPLELNRLVYDDSVILENKEEADRVVKAYRRYYGYQYLGNMFAFISSVVLSRSRGQKKMIKFFVMVLLPMTGFYIYSHFSYWDIVREVVIATRKRERELLSGDVEEREVTMRYNASLDLHKYIQANIGITKCILEIFNNKTII